LSCSTGVTAPLIDLSGQPSTVIYLYQFGTEPLTANFATMPLGSAVDVKAYLCVVFDAQNSRCSDSAATVGPEPGYANYRAQVSVTPCVVGEAPVVNVSGPASDSQAVWTLLDENGVETSDFGQMRSAQVIVNFTGALQGIADWTSDVVTCSGVPEPDPEPSVSPTP